MCRMRRVTRDRTAEPVSGANGDRETLFFTVQLTTSRIGNLTQLIYTLLYVMTIPTYTYILLGEFSIDAN